MGRKRMHPMFKNAFFRKFAAAYLIVTASVSAQDTMNFPTIGEIVRIDAAINALIPIDAKIEVLGSGFDWAEGPVWVPREGGFLIFSDVMANTVFQWLPGKGVSPFLRPSGYTGLKQYGREPGSNGLALDAAGRLLSCEHGDRRVSRLDWTGGKVTLADNYQGKRFNSPNDLAIKSDGSVYFTDPPYGLPKGWKDGRRELPYCGIYRLGTDGTVTLLYDKMTRPNGLAFSPDESILYVAQSDPKLAIWNQFVMQDDGTLQKPTLFYDATEMTGSHRGLPDGMAIDSAGNIWATGPGGVLIFSPEAKLLGRIDTKEATANCCFGPEERVLYITSDMYLCRVVLK